ncbi:hypothetical protein E2C01_081813 [Portunus trituberculatus]|uniref:Uncharacterized protein n=1 Tax=Portunus trituberculatus TaxID=210409 RepID=A0A5B7J243_PORTR|nr:hypothetical protein [Portunus trituberculatus]
MKTTTTPNVFTAIRPHTANLSCQHAKFDVNLMHSVIHTTTYDMEELHIINTRPIHLSSVTPAAVICH